MGDEIVFFGSKGMRDGERWLINALGGEVLIPVTKSSVLTDIRSCIANDIREGNGAKVAIVLTSAIGGVSLFLEDVLTTAHLSSKAVVEGTDHVDIPNVVIDGKSLTVRVLKEFEPGLATADSSGAVL
jgi:hypothetical protein